MKKVLAFLLVAAMLLALTACGGAPSSSQAGDSGSGDLSTATQVYIDLQGDSDSTIFHSHATCSRAGMRDGSMVVIDFVKDQGFSPCPYCWN